MNNKDIGGTDKLLQKLYQKFPFRLLLRLMISSTVSKLTGWFLDRKISKIFIKRFVKNNNIDLSQAVKQSFSSFNDFFIRELKPDLREVNDNDNILISPCDSCLSAYTVTKDKTFKIKKTIYTIEDLLNGDKISDTFDDGLLLIFRLRPVDYHRYIYFDDAKIISKKSVKGTYHTVNPVVHEHYKVYASNTREYNVMETKNFGICIQMEVGAMLVGRIKNIVEKQNILRGEEKGYFEFGGSTVIVLLQKDIIVLNENVPLDSNDELYVMRGQGVGFKL